MRQEFSAKVPVNDPSAKDRTEFSQKIRTLTVTA